MKKNSLIQKPNLPLIVGLAAQVLSWTLPYGTLNFIAALIAFGALFTWAWLEVFEGSNEFRKGLGFAVLVWLIYTKIA